MKIIFISILGCFDFIIFPIEGNSQPPITNNSLIAGKQDLCWTPDGQTIYFSGLLHKTDYSDFMIENWSIYKSKKNICNGNSIHR